MYEPTNFSTHIFANKPVQQHYSGSHDEENEMYEGIGSIIYNRDDYMQSYEGKFIGNNMHGYGGYQWQPLKYKYEGQFYANKKEGYGRFSYPSGAYFEGLYRNDQRFGPGVFTDAAGYQDVGIWIASKLIRLSRNFEPDHIMPRLAIRDEDKIRILRYRQIIHLQKDKIKHLAENLLESLTHLRNYDKNVLARAEELYNQLCRDNRSLSFNKSRYDKTFFGHESDQFTIDVLMTAEEVQRKIATEREETIIMMQDSSSIIIPRIEESKIVHEPYYPANIPLDEQYLGEISQEDVNVEIFQDEREEEDPGYCGIKEIDSETMNDILLLGNHEKQWNIFQSSAITIPPEFPENSAVNSLSGENLQGLEKTEALEKEFDDFGRKRIKDMQHTKKVVVTDLMAWNNSPMLIELLKHVFEHRNFEKKLSFDISEILAGRRGSFRQEGTHEKAALELLEACSSGWQNTISKLILTQNLDADIADSRGNTGLLLAAARDRIEVIDTLLNLGANVDSINDECLTPLSLCVLRLLELIHNVTDWSKAFLPKTIMDETMADDKLIIFKNVEQWHGRVSYESLVQQLPKRMDWNPLPRKINSQSDSKDFRIETEFAASKDVIDTEFHIAPSNVIEAEQRLIQELEHLNMRHKYNTDDLANRNGMQAQKYIFDVSPRIETSNCWRKLKNDKRKNKNNKRKVTPTLDKKLEDKNISSKSEELLKDNNNSEISAKKEKICTTVSKLLQRGADPNFAQVPHPVLIMAIFTQTPSLVTELLKYGADPDTTLSKIDYSLTPLLILAVLQPAYQHALMANALLKAKADPSIRADPEYRLDLLERLKRNRLSEFIDNTEGITALHLLAIRPDMDADVNEYLGELIKVICQHRRIKKSDLYQGHSPLSLAIFEGNLTAAKTFLRTTCVDVNEQLDADLGNAMLMLESCLMQELLPPDLLQEFLELLLEYGGCPFASARVLDEEYNQIEYGRKELMKMSSPPENKVEVNEKKNKNKSKTFRSLKLPDTRSFAKSMAFIEKIAKEKLIETIKANFVRDLMDSPIMLLSTKKQLELLKDPIFKNALTWMTGEDVAIVMKTMNYGCGNVRELVRLFVAACIMPDQETLTEIDTLIRKETERIINKVMPLVDPTKQIITAVNFKVDKRVGKGEAKNFNQIIARQSESALEDNRFKVCFECLTVHGKILILCPKCKRVYFCSQDCNLKCTTKEANLHQCPVFYQKEWIRLGKIATVVGLDPIDYMLGRFKNPNVYIDLERKTGLHIKPGGKKNIKNQEDNIYANTLKCENQDSTAYKKYGTDQLVDENRYPHEDKDDGTHATKGKQQKRDRITKTEYDDRDAKSDKQQKKSHTSDTKDKKPATKDIKSNKGKTDYLLDNEENRGRIIKSRDTDMKGHRFGTDSDGKNAFNNLKLKKGIEKNHKSGNDNEKAAGSDMKWKEDKKNRYRHIINEIEGSDGIKIKSKKDKEKNQIEEGDRNNIKSRTEKKKVKEDVNNTKFKGVDNRWRGKKGGKKSNDVNKREDDNIKDDIKKKREVRRNKQNWKNEINKKTREGESNGPNDKYKNNYRHHVKSNVPEKYLEQLLKIRKSAGKHLDIDMLLLPYVVFAQGDTYFRILPANQNPKFAGNYSLI